MANKMSPSELRRRFNLHNRRQAMFVMEYLVDLNAKQAAIRAGYSERGASVQGVRLLANANIRAAMEWGVEERINRVEITQDDVVQRLANIAFTDIDAFATWKGGKITLRDTEDIPKAQLGALAEASEGQHGLRIRLADRLRALALLARHLGMFPSPGTSQEQPLHVNIQEDEIDLSELTTEQLDQLGETIGAILAAHGIVTSSDPTSALPGDAEA